MTTTIFRTVLDEFAAAFETDTRNDGQRFTKRRDDCAPWVDSDVMLAIHQAVDDRLPDDWIYETAARVARDLLEYDSESADDARDNVTEIADSLVDVYTGDRLRWLASHHYNADIVDQACEELGRPDSIVDAIAYGQFYAIRAIADAVIQACEDESDARE